MMDIFQSTTDTGILTLTLGGKLDADTTNGFAELLNGAIERGEHRIILDLGGLSYVSSVGLRALIVGAKKLVPLGGTLVLCAAQPQILKLLEIAGFTSILTIVPTREAAAESFR
jgi:anti-anti-sigma factor